MVQLAHCQKIVNLSKLSLTLPQPNYATCRSLVYTNVEKYVTYFESDAYMYQWKECPRSTDAYQKKYQSSHLKDFR